MNSRHIKTTHIINSRQALNILKDNYHCKRDVELFKIIERDLDRLKSRDNTIKYAVKKLREHKK